MKRALLAITLVTGFIFMASSVFANPALLKKRHEGYPNPDGGTTATGATAAEKSATNAPKVLKDQNKAAEGDIRDQDQIKHSENSRLPEVVAPHHVTSKGVTENQIKEATKVNANPK
jgi:hypothetical protein